MKNIGTKATIAIMVVIVAVVGVMLAFLSNTATSFTGDMLQRQSKVANEAFAYTLQSYQDEALERAEMIAGSSDVINAVANGDHEALLSALKNLSTGLDLITLCDAEGTVLARTHNDKVGDNVLSQQAISTALKTGKGISTIEPGTVIGLSTRGSAAIKDAEGNIIGALTCGHDLSQTKYVDAIKQRNNCEVTFFAGSERMSTTLLDEKGNRVTGKANDDVIQTVIDNKQEYSGRIELFGTTYSVDYSPVIIGGEVIGMLFTGVDIEAALAQERSMVIMIIVSAVMLVLAVALVVWIITSTTKKAHWYESMLDSIPFPVSVTDMNMKWTFINKPVEDMLSVKRSDVLGKPCSNWGAAICNTGNCGVTCLRNNKTITTFEQMGLDFQVNVNYLHDTRGKNIGHIEVVQDITKTVETQKAQTNLVEQIRDVSSTFVQATRQISDGAQSLAQGSTEQAAAVQQLSSSISEIAQKTTENANMAGRAAMLANTIKESAEKGTRQMDQMTTAVRDINQASQNINKVIKAIDDIAFQTNILALNAAVEAARAGQHGKGFAVVAEEVRNLAAKSSEAAKETGSLIADSIEKAELGANIADETAASLAEIVSGINESSRLVGDIARSSDEQSVGISQINRGIDQVAQVVQQNSATAEESAAAASELSGQSDNLENLLDGFGSDNGTLGLPPAGGRR